jgi:hypothetical protein
LLKLLQRDIGGWGITVKVQARGIVGHLVLWCSELLLAVIDHIATLWVDAVVLLPQHRGQIFERDVRGAERRFVKLIRAM